MTGQYIDNSKYILKETGVHKEEDDADDKEEFENNEEEQDLQVVDLYKMHQEIFFYLDKKIKK